MAEIPLTQATFEGVGKSTQPKSPLRKFRGKMVGFNKEGRVVQFPSGPAYYTDFDFVELSNVEAVEPYMLPIARITLKLSRGGEWAVFAESVRNLVGENAVLEELLNKYQTWELTPGHDYGPDRQAIAADPVNNKDARITRDAWEIVELEGKVAKVKAGTVKAANAGATPAASTLTPRQKAEKLLDGKNEGDWGKAVMSDGSIMQDKELFNEILERQFIPKMVQAGKAQAGTDGVYKLIGA